MKGLKIGSASPPIQLLAAALNGDLSKVDRWLRATMGKEASVALSSCLVFACIFREVEWGQPPPAMLFAPSLEDLARTAPTEPPPTSGAWANRFIEAIGAGDFVEAAGLFDVMVEAVRVAGTPPPDPTHPAHGMAVLVLKTMGALRRHGVCEKRGCPCLDVKAARQ